MYWTEPWALTHQHVANNLQLCPSHLEEDCFCHFTTLAIFGVHRQEGRCSPTIPAVRREDILTSALGWLAVMHMKLGSSTVQKHLLTSKHSPDGPDSLTGHSMTAGSNPKSPGGQHFYWPSHGSCHTRARGHFDDLPVCCLGYKELVSGTQPTMYHCLQLFSDNRQEWPQTLPGDITVLLVSSQLTCRQTF